MRVKRRHELDMKTELVGSTVHAVVDALTVDERFDNVSSPSCSLLGRERTASAAS